MNTNHGPLQGRNILVVDDSDDMLILVQTFLKKAGARVVTASSGSEALSSAKSIRFDAILMDINMPEMGGLETTRVLRARGCESPILAFTSEESETRSADSILAGCNGHIMKNGFGKGSTDDLKDYFMRGARC